jgi:hypothetical protein
MIAPSNQWAADNRERKANAVVQYLLSCLIDNATTRTDSQWQEWFRFAAVKADDPPSEQTKAAIIEKLKMAERLFKATIS